MSLPSSESPFNPNLQGTPIIYVSFNYRLRPLGFPQGREPADRKAPNLALSDQLAALTWVQENIGAFGGYKNKATVFGVNAGAIMTAVQLLNPDFSKFARATILQSGSAALALTYGPLYQQVDWDNFVAGVPGCENIFSTDSTFECLRSVNTSAISMSDHRWDGFMPELPSLLFSKGIFAKIPFISGDDLDEGSTVFTPIDNYTTELIEDIIVANFTPPVAAAALSELYPPIPALGSPFNTGNDTFGTNPGYKIAAAIIGDLSFQSQRRFWTQTTSNAGVKTFEYLFAQPLPENPPFLGVAHDSEIPYVYGNVPNTTASEGALSMAVIDYWVLFATSLDPNDGKGVSRPTWEQYTLQNQACQTTQRYAMLNLHLQAVIQLNAHDSGRFSQGVDRLPQLNSAYLPSLNFLAWFIRAGQTRSEIKFLLLSLL
ncbi:alpha/beta-hydrolase [Gymnopus androsaceus JB14]|uniref:Alpha/beta-hydrolase n=1 Tax=Gymnopus androsaceus JB14 TaxID=1447944 RepID=A0A6A4HFK8_9AGAR|nr:alpha/beta-hydrolase [Gymnopus androsaceus JB14]